MSDERPDPMGDAAAQRALDFLLENAEEAGRARAQMIYMEHFRKSELARLKRESPERTDAGKEAWARAHEDYQVVLDAQWEATRKFEELSWRRTHAEATLEAWRTRSANNRGAGRI
jgi:hypothetical protein